MRVAVVDGSQYAAFKNNQNELNMDNYKMSFIVKKTCVSTKLLSNKSIYLD